MIIDPAIAAAEMARTRLPIWRPVSKSAAFRIQPLNGGKPRHLVSASVVTWLLNWDLIASADEHNRHSGEVYILTAEGWRLARLTAG